MKITTKMCHSHLMSMLLQPERMEQAVVSFHATTPLVSLEGVTGYIETTVEFDVKSLTLFTQLYESSYTYPSDRAKWYHTVRTGLTSCEQKDPS